jgi:sugar lactone lactonase YvrE
MSTSCLNPPTASSLCNPSQAALDTSGNLWVTDTNNNRVLMYPAGSATAGKVLGQPDFNSNSANNGGLGPSSLNSPHGVAIDSQGTLYVADSFNHRVLVYFNAASKGNDAPADLVLGQADFVHNLANGNTGNGSTCPAVATGTVTQCSLQAPTHLSLDQAGDLLVADSINNRVLLFAASNFNPVSHVSCAAVCYIPASMVWGQFGSFSTNGQNQSHTQGTNDPCPTNTTGAPSPCTLYVPTQAIADGNGDLYIVDRGNSRVLEYDGALNTGTTTYRQAATMVYGQDGSYSTGTANTGGLGPSSLSSPYSLALDPGGNLWVADTGNSRVLEFPSPVTTNRTAATSAIGVLGQRGSLTTGDQNNAGVDAGSLNQPTGIIFDAAGNAYLDDYVNTRILEYRQPYPVSARIGLAAGWNLVALPSETSLPYSASRVISQVNGEGGSANVVAVYQNGAYQVYVPGYSSDFSLAPKQGFWVLANAASIWALT